MKLIILHRTRGITFLAHPVYWLTSAAVPSHRSAACVQMHHNVLTIIPQLVTWCLTSLFSTNIWLYQGPIIPQATRHSDQGKLSLKWVTYLHRVAAADWRHRRISRVGWHSCPRVETARHWRSSAGTETDSHHWWGNARHQLSTKPNVQPHLIICSNTSNPPPF